MTPDEPGAGLHGRPTAAELVESVREYLADALAPLVPDDQRYPLRVATHVLGMVERELRLGPGQEAESRDRLAELGYAGPRELADAIRAGAVPPEQADAVRAAVEADVRARLAVARPGYDRTDS